MKARKRGPAPCNPKEEKFECTINGKTKTLAEWAALQGLAPEAIRARLSRRWSAHDAYNSTGKVSPGHRRLHRYETMSVAEIAALPVANLAADPAHLYLWCPNAMLAEALTVMAAWNFTYKTVIVWHKIRKDGGPDGRGVGFYFRNVTEMVLFGVRGRNARTLAPGRRQVNLMATRKREHSRKPDELYSIIEACSPRPWIELFARGQRDGWTAWGDEA